MTYLDQLPLERDLPASRQARMRHRVLAGFIAPGRPVRRRGRAMLGAGLATAACAMAVVVWTGGPGGGERPEPEVVALGTGVLSPMVRRTGDRCLTNAWQQLNDPDHPGEYTFDWPEGARPSLVNYAERENRAVTVYRLDQTMIWCSMEPTIPPSDEWSSGLGYGPAPSWLPGPVAGQSAGHSDVDGGEAQVAGYISRRVAKVVLDDGQGHRSTARLTEGTFAVLSDGALAPGKAQLISYDDQGREIDRRYAFDLGPVGTSCWVDPAGKVVVYGMDRKNAPTPSPAGCGEAEPWAPSKGWAPA
ncbi:hypothetical protein AB0B31_26595 [Catellatospora citrea]|uniref:hypothetical protein n=1 Tax=Catellatospora citrea TaxID=53366 RepID=UPI0033C5B3C3